MSLDFVKIRDIKLAAYIDRDIEKFHYLKVTITTEQGLKYSLFVETGALVRFLGTFH